MLPGYHPYQAVFVPVQTCATLLVNMVTGLLVWEDWQARVYMYDMYAYACVNMACPHHSLVLAHMHMYLVPY